MSVRIPVHIDPELATARAFARMSEQVKLARRDVNAFTEFCFEAPDGSRMRQDPVHREWQRFWTRNKYSVLLAPVGTGKSSQVRSRLLFEIGNNLDLQVVYVSATERHPTKQVRALKTEIESNERLKLVFPHLQPGEVWSSTEIQVRRQSKAPDPTIQIFGAFSQSVLGTRADLVVFDDLCNDSNTLTEHNRDRMSEWVGEVISRLKPTARVIAIGHIWDEFDQLQRWSRLPNWGYKRFTATYLDADGVEHSIAPGILSLQDIAEKEQNLGPIQSAMMLRNELPSHQHGRFRQAWFDACLKAGRGLSFVDRWYNGMAYTGVDLGHKKKPGRDLTVMFTAAILPDGSRQILDIRSGLWKAPEILTELADVYRRFGSIIAVENNSAQQYILDFAADRDCLPVCGHNTNASNKHNLQHGVEALGLQLEQARWRIPCDEHLTPNAESTKAIRACLAYDPKTHTPDHLMAWWICSEAMRLSPAGAEATMPSGLVIPGTDGIVIPTPDFLSG